MTTSASRAYLDHIVSQTRHNIEFLLAQDQISQTDASAILDRLPATWEQSSAAPIAPVPQATPARKVAPAPSSFASPPAYVPPAVTQCRALWAYKGEEHNDLAFPADAIIILVEEHNADWWSGTYNGKTGVFPANYVEKITEKDQFASNEKQSASAVYRPFRTAHHGTDLPPPPGGGAVNSVGLQQDPDQEKKGKYGKFGNTVAHSAAGGVGFGAGAAIGSGLVRAIF